MSPIEKSAEFRTWLTSWNFDIFGWKVYIGDVVETGIDWVIEWINSLMGWAEAIWNYIVDLIYEVREAFQTIVLDFESRFQALWDSVMLFWDRLELWWADKKQDVLDLIAAGTAWVKDRIDSLSGVVDGLRSAWDWFTGTVLPGLADIWTVDNMISNALRPWADMFNWFEMFRSEVVEFFNDPWQWLYDRFEDFIERFW